MHIREDLDARKLLKLLPEERGWRFHEPGNFELPFVYIDLGRAGRIKHRPPPRANLAWRQAILGQCVRADDHVRPQGRRCGYFF